MGDWLFLQTFYNGLTPTTHGHIDAVAEGDLFSLTIDNAKALIEKIISNQG
jgi:hypothetical protein